MDCEWAEALSDKEEDRSAAARRLDFQLGWYSPFFCWTYYIPHIVMNSLASVSKESMF